MRLVWRDSCVKKETTTITSVFDDFQIEPLDNEEEMKLRKLQHSYPQVITDVGYAMTVKHRINYKDDTSTKQGPYPITVSYTHLDVYKRQN